MALPEVRLGLLPWMRGLQHLTTLAGPGLALDLALSGRDLDPSEALRAGIVSSAVEPAWRAADPGRCPQARAHT